MKFENIKNDSKSITLIENINKAENIVKKLVYYPGNSLPYIFTAYLTFFVKN